MPEAMKLTDGERAALAKRWYTGQPITGDMMENLAAFVRDATAAVPRLAGPAADALVEVTLERDQLRERVQLLEQEAAQGEGREAVVWLIANTKTGELVLSAMSTENSFEQLSGGVYHGGCLYPAPLFAVRRVALTVRTLPDVAPAQEVPDA